MSGLIQKRGYAMRLSIAAVLVVTLLAPACSGISVNQDFNPATQFSSLQTWDWMPVNAQRSGDPRADNAIVDQRIRSAIEEGLQAKGLRKVASGEPNFRVGYHLILDDRVDYETVNNYYGAGWGYRGVYGRYGPTMATSQTYTREYTMGTLIIDFFDVGSHELVWRGSAEGKINEVSDPVKKQERANQAVQKILGQFPPKG
jgi:hypothetical protein